MYPLTPVKMYVLERALRDPACTARLDRMLAAIGRRRDEVVVITEQNIGQVVTELATLWPPATVPEGQTRSYTRPLVFNTMELDYDRPDLSALLARCPEGTTLWTLGNIYGHYITACDQHPHELDQVNNCVCWPTFNFGTIWGCPHGCLYCGAGREGKFIGVTLNLEEYMEKVVAPTIELYPWNKVFRMILSGADLIAFEPEYGLHDLFSRVLARYPDRWGHFHTSGTNVEWIADLEHRDRLVGVWSLSCEAGARDIEDGAGSIVSRLDAARKCQDMGLSIRFKFKPIIPLRNWRDDYAGVIEEMFKRTRPDSVGFAMYIWNTFESMAATLPLDLLDPEMVQAAKDSADKMKTERCGPFPHETRKEIYRFFIRQVRRWDKEVPLYVSTETREMWNELKDELGQDPRNYICGCSSVALPGRKMGLSPAFRYSTYNPTPM